MIVVTDETAISILKSIAQKRLQSESSVLPPVKEIRDLLCATFEDLPLVSATEGEVARFALDLLAEDPAFSESIRSMAGRPIMSRDHHKYLDTSGIAMTTAVLLVLPTRIKFKLNETRQWSIEFDKGAIGNAMVKQLVQRLLSLLDRFSGR